LSARLVTRFIACTLMLPAVLIAAACEKPPAPPHNDNFASAVLLPATAQGRAVGTTVGATRQASEPQSITASTVWFRWQAPSNGTVTFSVLSAMPTDVEVFTGSAVGHLRAIATDDAISKADFRISQGTSYSVRVTSYSSAAFGMKWSASSPPVNDAPSGALAISGSAGSLVTDATAATAQTTDPSIDTVKVPATVWYRWTAPATGWYDFDTSGSRVSTALGVYTDVTPAQLIADSSGDCGAIFDVSSASVRFPATVGASYLVMIGGTASDLEVPDEAGLGGPVQLNWRSANDAAVASGNDAFSAATPIAGNNGSINGSTDGATTEGSEPALDGAPAQSSVWFSYTPTVTSDYVLSALPDDSDACVARLGVYTGDSVGTLRAIHANNDDLLMSASIPSSRLSAAGIDVSGGFSASGYGLQVHLFAGTTYRIAADGRAHPGAFTLRWDIPQAAPVIRSATPGNGSIGVIWAPPRPTAGTVRTGYFVAVEPADPDDFDTPDPQLLAVNFAFTTIHGLRNGVAYRVIVAAVNDSGLGTPAFSGLVTPKKPK
jgi:hypothetical protein